jgi:hypothetical protein
MTFKELIPTLPQHIQDKLETLKGMRERKDYHPEPSVWHHIEIVTNRCIRFGDKDLIMAGIFHDLHKLDTMVLNPKTGHPSSPGHDKWASKTIQKDEIVREFITSFGADPEIVAGICGEHMRMHQIAQMRPLKQKKMADLPYFDKLAVFCLFDDMLSCDTAVQLLATELLSKYKKGLLDTATMGKMANKSR